MKKYSKNLIFLKLLSSTILSIFLAGVTLYITNFIFARVLTYSNLGYFFRLFKDIVYIRFGKDISVLFVLLTFFVLYLYLLTRRTIVQLSKVIDTLDTLDGKNLNIKVPVIASNEMGKLATNINSLVYTANKAIENQKNADRTKNELITNVSHDLRTPLTSILGYLNIIDNDKYRDEVELRYYVNIAHEKAKVLDILINDLFELTKVRNAGLKLDIHKIDIVELLSQLMEYNQMTFHSKNIIGRTFFSEDKFIINGDGNKLARTFENIISNAIKYGSSSDYVDILTSVKDNIGEVIIRNYGDPISTLDIPHIFDRFYKSDKSRTSTENGSGLGLAIAKGIIELHKGTISVESDDHATSFIIRLPLA